MKKNILTLIAIATVMFSACKKDHNDNPGGGTPGTSESYQPVTKGSKWSYRNESTVIPGLHTTSAAVEVDTLENIMTDVTKVVNGKTYHKMSSTTGGESEDNYFAVSNHIYYNLNTDELVDGEVELPYLNDQAAVNTVWTTAIEVPNAPKAQVKSTVVEKGITKSILGKNYSNVIHTMVELQIFEDANYVTFATVDYYVARGVGVIGIYTSFDGHVVGKSELISYSIK